MQCTLIQIQKYLKLQHSGIGKRLIFVLKINNRGGEGGWNKNVLGGKISKNQQ